MEKKIEITLVPKEQIDEDQDMIRITLECSFIVGWGCTLQEAIKDFDRQLVNK